MWVGLLTDRINNKLEKKSFNLWACAKPWTCPFNTIECNHRGKGDGSEEKKQQQQQFWAISYFWIEVFLKDVLGLLAYEGTTFMLNLSS